MVLDPVTTFAVYLIGILAVFTVCAVVADLWLAYEERRERIALRDQARAQARAQRREERELSSVEWQ